tara:strand:- start:11458 stop:12051 length:594 start_codon:yes stop_codon:yes gene_type:complete
LKLSKKEEYLRQIDPKLKKIIDSNGHIVFKPKTENQFDSLVGIVISQFISTKASNSIYQKIKAHFKVENLNEIHFQKLTIKDIKKLGLSTNKAKTIKNLSDLYLSKNMGDLTKLNNDSLNDKLISVFGIGQWSINMFEIFCMGNMDVFSSKDAGLRLAMNNSGMIKSESNWNLYDEYAKKWTPFKTIASLHLWKTVD